jgi:hypothetical protein
MAKLPVTPNYSAAQEAMISDAFTAKGSALNYSDAKALGERMDKNPKSVTAKIVRMGIPYAKAGPVTKSGAAVVRKKDIVAEIAKLCPGNLTGLEDAPKAALEAIRDRLDFLTD